GARVERVASLAEHRANLRLALLERLQMVLAMIENDAAESVINAVVDVIAAFAVAHRFADHAGHRSGRGRHEETPRLREYFDVRRKQPVDLGVDLPREQTEGVDMLVVRRGKTAADVQNLDFVSARLRLAHHRRGDLERLHEILEVRALAPHMEAESL